MACCRKKNTVLRNYIYGNNGGSDLPVPEIQVNPVISGLTALGSTLTGTTGSWLNSPTSYAYQWYRDGVAIVGATNNTYITVLADSEADITFEVIASNATGPSLPATSNTIALPSYAPVNTVAPAVTGVAIVSQTLSCSTGTWTNSPSFTYQWQRGGVDIGGATNNTYLLVAADAGQTIRCVVTASNGVGAPVSANSNNVSVYASFLDVANTGSQVAFSPAMLLRGAHYGSPIIRLRRTGDNAELDFGVGTDGLLDTAAVLTWVAAGGGTQGALAVTIYDQSGNARNATNATPTEQAVVVSSGALANPFGTNLRPALTFDGTNDFYDFGNAQLINGANPGTDFIVAKPTGANAYKVVASIKTGATNVFYFFSNDPIYQTFSLCSSAGISNRRFPNAPFNANYLINSAYNGSGLTTPANFSARVNNVNQTLASSAAVGAVTANNFLGKSGDGSFMQGQIAAFIRFGSDVTANYTALNGNLNAFYGIY